MPDVVSESGMLDRKWLYWSYVLVQWVCPWIISVLSDLIRICFRSLTCTFSQPIEVKYIFVKYQKYAYVLGQSNKIMHLLTNHFVFFCNLFSAYVFPFQTFLCFPWRKNTIISLDLRFRTEWSPSWSSMIHGSWFNSEFLI